jgi:hypothetical protein
MCLVATNACARCGATIEAGEHLCWRCQQELPIERPAAAQVSPQAAGRTFRGQPVPEGMVLPSRTQYHGTVFGAIAVGVAIVLTLGVLVNRGVGPFTVSNPHTSIALSPAAGPVITATVQNMGDHAGQARCIAFWTDQNGGTHPTPVVSTQTIEPGMAVPVLIQLPVGSSTDGILVSCK